MTQMSHAQTVAFNAGAAEAGRRIAEELKMRCPQCSAIAPENEKDWPDTECVVCVLRAEVERLKSVLYKTGDWVAAVDPKLPMPGKGDSQQEVLNMIELALRGEWEK